MTPCTTGALVLAAGKGTRMYSDTPKVLQKILHEPLLHYVYASLTPLFGDAVWTIVGHGAGAVQEAFPSHAAKAIVQTEQLGTGHAVQTAWPAITQAGIESLVVINGDTPQVNHDALKNLMQCCADANNGNGADLGFMTLTLADPLSYGRVIRKNGKIIGIIEAKDYDTAIHGVGPHEINAGIYWLRVSALTKLLPLLSNNNKSGEFYITDLVSLAVEKNLTVIGVSCGNDTHLMGVNTPFELTEGEEHIRRAIIHKWQSENVFIRQAESVRIGPNVQLAKGVDITGPCEIYGKSTIGSGCVIESHCKILDCHIADQTQVRSYSHLQNSTVGANVTIGPYARLRPETVLADNVHVGNFVEIKKSYIGNGAKVNHLTYVGDAEVGRNANIGAGTITCNYDGVNKHKTIIGNNAFIGSNTALVAPITVGDNALIGAGSTITKSVPDSQMAIARGKQVNLPKRKF